MQDYEIGLSSLAAAYAAMDTVGNNVANAATEGYHRQRIDLSPSSNSQAAGTSGGGGVDVIGVTRMIDTLLEREIINQKSSYNSVSRELSTLSSIETSVGEFSDTGGLNSMIDAFFSALQGLAANPSDQVQRNNVLSSAETLTAEFRRLGTSLTAMNDQIVQEAQQTVQSINSLTHQVADLNSKIQEIEISQGQANNLRDRRDDLISQLAELVNVETQQRDYGVVDISIGGLPVVAGTIATDLSVAQQKDQSLGVAAAGSEGNGLNISGGRLGGLLSLKNQLLPQLSGQLDTLAQGLINQVNRCHTQGTGADGSFTELTGWSVGSDSLSAAGVTDGDVYIRVTNTKTGEVKRYQVAVDLSGSTPDTLSSVAAKINDIDGLNASIVSSQLHIAADSGYTFDFIPAPLSTPADSQLSGKSPPSISVSGIYNGSENQTLTFTTVGTGSVGNGDLRLEVHDPSGQVIATLNVGAGYAAGDEIQMDDGLKIAVGQGDLNEGDQFSVDALATTDTSGLLAAAGINVFFSGASAGEMRVCDDIINDSNRIATAAGADGTDNTAVLQLSRIQDQAVASLQGMTPSEYYQRFVANLGEEVSLRQSGKDNGEAMLQSLDKQQSDISGVDINDEAAQLLLYERMFQAAAKYINTLQTSMDALMNVI